MHDAPTPKPTLNAKELLTAARAAYLRGEVDTFAITYGEMAPERPIRGDFWMNGEDGVYVWDGTKWEQ